MARNDEDKREDVSEPSDTIEDAIVDALGEAAKDPDDDDGPRQSAVVRWLNFLVIMIVLGLIVAGLSAWWTYNYSTHTGSRYYRRDAPPMTDQQWNDLKHDVRRNGIIGFVIGAAIGGGYAVKCLVRGVDP